MVSGLGAPTDTMITFTTSHNVPAFVMKQFEPGIIAVFGGMSNGFEQVVPEYGLGRGQGGKMRL